MIQKQTNSSNTNKNVGDIESYNTENVVDSSSRELVETIRANRKRFLFGRKTPIYYSVDETMTSTLDSFYDSFAELEDCDSMWYVYAKEREAVGNYHNIDSSKILRKEIAIKYGNPKFIKTNVVVPCIEAGNQELYFFPDKLLVAEGKKVGALSYNNLVVEIEKGKFKEDGDLPSDAKVVETTYKYVNKDGGPDKRYSYNPKTSIVEYTYIYFKGNRGFNECIMLSKSDVGEKLKFEIEKLKSLANYKENSEDVEVIESNVPEKKEANEEPVVNQEETRATNMFYKKWFDTLCKSWYNPKRK